jgi:hypothetical protein
MPGVRDSSETTWTHVAVDQTIDVDGQINGEPASIQGEIRGAWRDLALSPPSLALFNQEGQTVRGFRVVAINGTFDEEIYLPEPVKLAVRQDGVNQWIGGDDFETAQVFDLSPGSVTSGVVFTQSGLRIELQPPYTSPDFPFVRIHDITDMTLVAEWRPTISSAGPIYSIGNIKPGTYVVQFDPTLRCWDAWAPQWYDRQADAAAATPVTIGAAGEVVTIPVTLQRGGTISGTVLDPVDVQEGWSFFVTTADDPAQWGSYYTRDLEGTYTIHGLPDGAWKVGAFREVWFPDVAPDDTVWFPGMSDWQDADVITTSGFEDVTGVDIVMP